MRVQEYKGVRARRHKGIRILGCTRVHGHKSLRVHGHEGTMVQTTTSIDRSFGSTIMYTDTVHKTIFFTDTSTMLDTTKLII